MKNFEEGALLLLEAITEKVRSGVVPSENEKDVLMTLMEVAEYVDPNDTEIVDNTKSTVTEEWSPMDNIVILGDSKVEKQSALAIIEGLGLPPAVFCNPYESDDVQCIYNPHCRGVIIGPVPHKLKGVSGGDPRVLLQEKGIPFAEARSGTDLKLTKTSLRDASRELLIKLSELDFDSEAA